MNLTISDYIQISLALIAIGLTIYYRRKDNANKKLYYILKNKTIIDNDSGLNEINVSYKKTDIYRLTQTELLIFNRKSKTIKFDELGKKIGLTLLFFKNTKIFESNIIDYDNPNVNFNLKSKKNILDFKFDYFKIGNFVYIKILSNEQKTDYPILKGEFIDNGKLLKFNSAKFKRIEFTRVIPFILIFSSILMFISKLTEIQDWILVLISSIFGYIIIDILRLIRNNKLDKRILYILYKD